MGGIELLDVPAVDPVHRLTQVRQRGLNEQVVVVSHQTVGVAYEIVPHACSLDQSQKPCPIFIAQEDGSTKVPAGSHVVEAIRALISTSGAHAP
jgi:hypothetical protein